VVGKNLSTAAHTNVEIRHCYVSGTLDFVSASDGGVDQAATGCPASHDREVFWSIADWQPGAEFSYDVSFTAQGGPDTVGRAIFTSAQLPSPGFQTVAYTVIDSLSIVETSLTASPNFLASAAGTVTYTATVGNDGTDTASMTSLSVTLPDGFSYDAGSAGVNGTSVADPAVGGNTLTFTTSLTDVMAGQTLTVTFDVTVDSSASDGSNTSILEVWFNDPFKGEDVNNSVAGVGEVVIGTPRSDSPAIQGPLQAGDTLISGTTSEAADTLIRIFFAGVEVATGMSDASGDWSVTVPPLFGGQRVSASAQAGGELESPRSGEILVSSVDGTSACSDGEDNDGDGKTDFPDDPDCTSPGDPDEGHTPECADGADNDGDGDTDFGADLGCSSLLDDSEAGGPACSDGVDNDGDGKTDFPDDPGCDAADDVREDDVPACADGEDNDGDGRIDFPEDRGCESALDDSESAGVTQPPDAGMPEDPAPMGDSDAGATGDGGSEVAADAADLGGIDEPSSGCGCRVVSTTSRSPRPMLLMLLAVVTRLRSRRRR